MNDSEKAAVEQSVVEYLIDIHDDITIEPDEWAAIWIDVEEISPPERCDGCKYGGTEQMSSYGGHVPCDMGVTLEGHNETCPTPDFHCKYWTSRIKRPGKRCRGCKNWEPNE